MFDKFLDILQGTPLIALGCDIWNASCNLIGILIGQTPQTMKGEAWGFMTGSIYPIFLTLGIALMSLFFCIGYVRECADIRQTLTLENSIKMFVRIVLANALVTSAIIWIPQFLVWATDTVKNVGAISGGFGTLDKGSLTGNFTLLDTLMGGVLGSWLLSFVFLIMCLVCGILIVVPVYKRVFHLLLLIPLAPVALAGIAGGQGINHTASSYFKEFIASCFEIVVLALVMVLGGYFMRDPIFSQMFASTGHISTMLEAMFSMTLITTMIRTANAFLKRALGL